MRSWPRVRTTDRVILRLVLVLLPETYGGTALLRRMAGRTRSSALATSSGRALRVLPSGRRLQFLQPNEQGTGQLRR